MLVFVSDYPDELTERDGAMQRIAGIDSIFAGHERLYLEISWKRHWRRRVAARGPVSIERVNFFVHYRHIGQRLKEASCVYVHSVYNAVKSLPHIWKCTHKAVLDAHGAVPEELVFTGRRGFAAVCRLAERVMVRNCPLLVVVTQRMRQHFLMKYCGQLDGSRILTLPNLIPRRIPPQEPRCRRTGSPILRLIYIGGVQQWQNIDLMMDALRRLANLREDWQARVFVPVNAIPRMRVKVNLAGCGGRVTVGSLPHSEVMKEYAAADAGFVLRDATLLNQVAMPTKLVEYMDHGVVPIVLSPDIGDFLELGYKFLTIEDLFNRRKLHPDRLKQMRNINSHILAGLYDSALEAQRALVSWVEGGEPAPLPSRPKPGQSPVQPC